MFITTGTFEGNNKKAGIRRLNHGSDCDSHDSTSLSSTSTVNCRNLLRASLVHSSELPSLSNWFLGTCIPAWASSVEVSQTMPPLCPSHCEPGDYQSKPGADYCSLLLRLLSKFFHGVAGKNLLTVNRLITAVHRVRSESY